MRMSGARAAISLASADFLLCWKVVRGTPRAAAISPVETRLGEP